MFYKLSPLLMVVGLASGGPVSSEASEAAEAASEEPHLHPAAGDKEAFLETLPKHPKDISLPSQAPVTPHLIQLNIQCSLFLTGCWRIQ